MDKFKITIIESISTNPNITFEEITACLNYLLEIKFYTWSGTREHIYFNRPSGRTRRIAKALYKNTKDLIGHSHYLVFFNNKMSKYYKEN